MLAALTSIGTNITAFFVWWLFLMPKWIFLRTQIWLANIDDSFQLLSNLRLWFSFEPLFGDYGWKGRIIGFIFRGIRFAYSLIIMLAVLLFGIGLILLWLILPIISIWLIIYG